MRRIASILLAAALAAGLSAGSAPGLVVGAPAQAGAHHASPRGAKHAVQPVTWHVDQDAKVITATVRLTLAAPCSTKTIEWLTKVDPSLLKRCTVSDDVVKAIREQVDASWNKDRRYKCYRLAIVLDIKVDARPSEQRTPVGDDRLYVEIDQSTAHFKSNVRTTEAPGARWDGNSPSDRITPTNGDEQPSTWGFPPDKGDVSVFAHEVGHVLGLDEHYEKFTAADGSEAFRPKKGAPKDVMSDITTTDVDPATVDRLVERSDAFKTEKVKCDYRVNTRVDWYVFTGTKCGGPEGEWEIAVDGTRDLGGGRLILHGAAHATLVRNVDLFTGPWDARYAIIAETPGPATGGQHGTVSGSAVLRKGVLHMKGEVAVGDFWAQAPHFSRSGKANPLRDLDLHVENGSFCH